MKGLFLYIMEGCILLSRSILESEVFASQKMLKIWIWCLCKANYKDRFVSLKIGKGERIIKVKRGQFLFGRFKAEEELFIDGSTIYKIIKKLEEIKQISIQSNNQYSIITICNYNHYQDIVNYKVASKEQPSNNQVTAEEQQSNTPKKDNKDNKDKKDRNIIPPPIELVESYFKERGINNTGEPQSFMDYYISNGWKVGKNKMIDWQAAVRNWIKRIDNKTSDSPIKLDEPL